jgi:hypothetical protein
MPYYNYTHSRRTASIDEHFILLQHLPSASHLKVLNLYQEEELGIPSICWVLLDLKHRSIHRETGHLPGKVHAFAHDKIVPHIGMEFPPGRMCFEVMVDLWSLQDTIEQIYLPFVRWILQPSTGIPIR